MARTKGSLNKSTLEKKSNGGVFNIKMEKDIQMFT